MKAICVTHFDPRPDGDGGSHRAYQIQHDLGLAVGPENVVAVSLSQREQAQARARRTGGPMAARVREHLQEAAFWGRRRISYYRENPLKLWANTSYSTNRYASRAFLADYRNLIGQMAGPACCVIEHTGFARLIDINTRRGVPTICCPHNLEAFDMTQVDWQAQVGMYAAAIDFANEFRVLAWCAERLLISRIETGLIGGLGIPSRYYPYVPVAALRQRLEDIRRERVRSRPEPGLFLMLGSAWHGTTWRSFKWFTECAMTHGLPEGVRVIVAGRETEQLLRPGASVPGLELRGWLEQAELDRLLARAAAVLAPHRVGFGALTRLPELACAGIPVIASAHAGLALDPPPGMVIVEDNWDSWCRQMQRLVQSPSCPDQLEYADWEARQPKTLTAVVSAMKEARWPRERLSPMDAPPWNTGQ